MESERVGAWLEGYRRAWEQADTPAVVGLFTGDASYRSHPLRPAHTGHDGIGAYWAQATADQDDVRVRFGEPIVDGDRAAVEWWNLAEGLVDPPAGWGRLGPDAGNGAAGHAGRWAAGYERAWRADDPEAAAALYAPEVVYRSEPFRDPHLGRDGVLVYTRRAYATEADQDPHFGTPVAADSSAAVEYWAAMLDQDQPVTLIGTAVLTFEPDGLVAESREYWFLEPGTHPPYESWGR